MSKKKSHFHYLSKNCGLYDSQSVEFLRLYSHYKTIALNTYRWEGLPNGIESRHIESFLFETGQVAFYEDADFGIIALPCSTGAKLNLYGDPTNFVLTGTGYTKRVQAEEAARVLNNDLALPTSIHISHYAERMAEIEDIMRQNARQQRFPYVVSVDKANEFTMKNMMKQVLEGQEAIYVDKTLTETGNPGIQAITTDAPYLLDKLEQHLRDLEQELLTFLGLNSTRGKTSGMTDDEVNVNNSEIVMNLDLGFKTRELAAKAINEKFGLNVSVVKVIEEITPIFDNIEKEVSENGKV